MGLGGDGRYDRSQLETVEIADAIVGDLDVVQRRTCVS